MFLRLFPPFSPSAAVHHPPKRSRTRRQRKYRDKMLFFIFTKYALCVNYNGKRARNQSVWYFSVVLFIAPSLAGVQRPSNACTHYHSWKSVDGGVAKEEGDSWFQPDWWTEAFNYTPFTAELSPLLYPAAHHLHFALIPYVCKLDWQLNSNTIFHAKNVWRRSHVDARRSIFKKKTNFTHFHCTVRIKLSTENFNLIIFVVYFQESQSFKFIFI